MHTVAVLALDDVIAFDLATPVGTFGFAHLPDGRPAYRALVCGAPSVRAEAFTMRPDWGLDVLAEADTIVLPGRTTMDAPVPAEVVDALRAAAARGTRIASICVGAFVLAATGLLDGLRATTHWRYAARFRELFPAVDLDPDVLFVDDGDVLTSA
ncbi:GlxA family transcriptional regulator, partial [Actinophytocola sp.]|uniref:GlxA family transcriptional regulator n=1 Tax=Actinophytocola sp. TaxID=1872138 RepID=UPI00389A882C